MTLSGKQRVAVVSGWAAAHAGCKAGAGRDRWLPGISLKQTGPV